MLPWLVLVLVVVSADDIFPADLPADCDVLRGTEHEVGESPAIEWQDSSLRQDDGERALVLQLRVPAIYDDVRISFKDATSMHGQFTDAGYIDSSDAGFAGWALRRVGCYRYYEVELRFEDALTWAGLSISLINDVPHWTSVIRIRAEEPIQNQTGETALDNIGRTLSYDLPFRIQMATQINVTNEDLVVEEMSYDYVSVLTHLANPIMNAEDLQPTLELEFVTAVDWPYKLGSQCGNVGCNDPGIAQRSYYDFLQSGAEHWEIASVLPTGEASTINVVSFERIEDCDNLGASPGDGEADCVQRWRFTTKSEDTCFVDGEYRVAMHMVCNANPSLLCDDTILDRVNAPGEGVHIKFTIETEQGKEGTCGKVMGTVEIEGWLRSYNPSYSTTQSTYEAANTAYFQTGVTSEFAQVQATSIREITVNSDLVYRRLGGFGSAGEGRGYGMDLGLLVRDGDGPEPWRLLAPEDGREYGTAASRFEFVIVPRHFPTGESSCGGPAGCEVHILERQCMEDALECEWDVGAAQFQISALMDVTYTDVESGTRRRRLLTVSSDDGVSRQLEEELPENDANFGDETKLSLETNIIPAAKMRVTADVELQGISIQTFALIQGSMIDAYAQTLDLPASRVFVADVRTAEDRRLSEGSSLVITYGIYVYEESEVEGVRQKVESKRADPVAFKATFKQHLVSSVSRMIQRSRGEVDKLDNMITTSASKQLTTEWQAQIYQINKLAEEVAAIQSEIEVADLGVVVREGSIAETENDRYTPPWSPPNYWPNYNVGGSDVARDPALLELPMLWVCVIAGCVTLVLAFAIYCACRHRCKRDEVASHGQSPYKKMDRSRGELERTNTYTSQNLNSMRADFGSPRQRRGSLRSHHERIRSPRSARAIRSPRHSRASRPSKSAGRTPRRSLRSPRGRLRSPRHNYTSSDASIGDVAFDVEPSRGRGDKEWTTRSGLRSRRSITGNPSQEVSEDTYEDSYQASLSEEASKKRS